jgi:Protein of unknown function (DUF2511)
VQIEAPSIVKYIFDIERLESNHLSCNGGNGLGAVIFSSNGITYAVNGIAKGRKTYNDIEAIWVDNPAIPGSQKNLSTIIDLADVTESLEMLIFSDG